MKLKGFEVIRNYYQQVYSVLPFPYIVLPIKIQIKRVHEKPDNCPLIHYPPPHENKDTLLQHYIFAITRAATKQVHCLAHNTAMQLDGTLKRLA